MSARKRLASGFTLVEILIVVVILGILAAIVVPQFTNASQVARASNLVSQLQSVRSQLELYQVQHNGVYPNMGDGLWTEMITETDVNGTVGVGNAFPFGPYLQQSPANPFITTIGNADITINQASPVPGFLATAGWAYDNANGQMKANTPATVDAVQLGLDNPLDFNNE